MTKKPLWALITALLTFLTIYMFFSQSGLSFSEFLEDIQEANYFWLIPAAVCMLLYIIFEGTALTHISRALGYPVKHRKGFLYASADIYFSSITPSASGGQPASAFFMIKDGISTSVATASLILNVTMYTIAIITIGLFCVLFSPRVFLSFPLVCKLMILFGIVAMLVLMIFFIILLKKYQILLKAGHLTIIVLNKLHFKTAARKLESKLSDSIEKYKACVRQLYGKKTLLLRIYILNLLQRISQILVTVFVYFALHGDYTNGLLIFIIQSYVVIGSNFIPVPGAIGISEFIMFCGYSMIADSDFAGSLALVSRGISFYTCSIISIFTVILGYIFIRMKDKKAEGDAL